MKAFARVPTGTNALKIAGILAAFSTGCGSDSHSDAGDLNLPTTYQFESRFQEGSSVAYREQALRQVLIRQIDRYIDGLTARIDEGRFVPVPGEVRAALESYYALDADMLGDTKFSIGINASFEQATFNEIARGTNIQAKFAGNDTDFEDKAWKSEFVGGDVPSSEAQLLRWFDEIDALCVSRVNGEYARSAEEPVYVTAAGVDLKQMVQKTLMMGATFSQAMDVHLDEEIEQAQNSQVSLDGKKQPYTVIEHVWDEAFGAFGAARDYGTRDAKQNSESPIHDTNKDGKIDVESEVTFYMGSYAAKRDLAAVTPTGYSSDLWNAFLSGRTIIAEAGDKLTEDERKNLLEQRDAIRTTWENMVAANVSHYLNAIILDLAKLEEGGFAFADLAKHFSEMKGFALGLQFNPALRLSEEDFAALHEAVGTAPVSPDAGKKAVDDYRDKLLEARGILAKTYQFDEANVGLDDGSSGF